MMIETKYLPIERETEKAVLLTTGIWLPKSQIELSSTRAFVTRIQPWIYSEKFGNNPSILSERLVNYATNNHADVPSVYNTNNPIKADPVTEIGIYRTANGNVYRVQMTRAQYKGDTNRNLYAKKLTPIGGKRLTENGEIENFDFVCAPSEMRNIRASDRLSFDEAKALSIQYGHCMVCGIFLKDSTSVVEGIGPVCRKKKNYFRMV